MFKKYFVSLALLALLVLPIVTFASTADNTLQGPTQSGATLDSTTSGGCQQPHTINDIFTYAICIINGSIIPFLIGLAVVLFMAGVVRYVAAGDNEEKRQGGRDLMIFGIIALFVMVSVWGFVKILHTTFFADSPFQVNNNSPIQSH